MDLPIYSDYHVDRDTASYIERTIDMKARVLVQVESIGIDLGIGGQEDYET